MIAGDERLRSYVNRIERLEEEKRGLGADIRDVYSEAKSAGYDPKIMRALIKERRLGEAERARIAAELETYRNALGALADTPLGGASIGAAAAALEAEARAVVAAGLVERVDAIAAGSTTVSLNGGPAVPLETLAAAVKAVKGRRGRGKVAPPGGEAATP